MVPSPNIMVKAPAEGSIACVNPDLRSVRSRFIVTLALCVGVRSGCGGGRWSGFTLGVWSGEPGR